MKETETTQNNLLDSCLKEKKILDNLIKKAHKDKIPVIDKNTGRFLELVCLLAGPKNILEIGCGIGFSTYFLVKNLKDGNYTGIDLNNKRIKKAEKFIRSSFPDKNFKFLSGNALKIIPELRDRFDLVFIDGAKYEYPLYIKAIEDKLNDEALVIADNIFYKNKIFEEKITRHDLNSVNGIKKYINYVTSCKYFKSYFYDIGDGISITKYLKS